MVINATKKPTISLNIDMEIIEEAHHGLTTIHLFIISTISNMPLLYILNKFILK